MSAIFLYGPPASGKTTVGKNLALRAGILVNNGAGYGTGGEGFVRLNIGCPRSIVDEALERFLKLK